MLTVDGQYATYIPMVVICATNPLNQAGFLLAREDYRSLSEITPCLNTMVFVSRPLRPGSEDDTISSSVPTTSSR